MRTFMPESAISWKICGTGRGKQVRRGTRKATDLLHVPLLSTGKVEELLRVLQ